MNRGSEWRIWDLHVHTPLSIENNYGCANDEERLCQNAGTTFFYAQSPDFHKPGLCYYPKFLYL